MKKLIWEVLKEEVIKKIRKSETDSQSFMINESNDEKLKIIQKRYLGKIYRTNEGREFKIVDVELFGTIFIITLKGRIETNNYHFSEVEEKIYKELKKYFNVLSLVHLNK